MTETGGQKCVIHVPPLSIKIEILTYINSDGLPGTNPEDIIYSARPDMMYCCRVCL